MKNAEIKIIITKNHLLAFSSSSFAGGFFGYVGSEGISLL
jgi:hypothetical protein